MTLNSTNAVEVPVPPRTATASRRGSRRPAAVALAAVLVVAVVAGVVWAQIAPRLEFLVTVVGPFPVTEETAGRVVDADAWFAVLSVAVGIAAGVAALVLVAPSDRGRAPIGLGITAAGLSVMFVTGQLIANARLVWSWNPVAGDNHQVTGPLVLQAWGIVTIAPIIALLIVLASSIVSDGERRAG